MSLARQAADAGRVIPGTPEFDQLKNTIIGINNWDHKNAGIEGAPETGGAWLLQKSRMYNTDAQWDLSNKIKFVDLLLGADLRIYEVIPDGNNFVDFSRPIEDRTKPGGSNVYYKKYGGFVQATKTFFDDKLKLFASLRYDYNPYFDPKLNPRVALVYTLKEKHNFRASFQNGFRFPALFEALSFVNNGNVRRVGGLSFINEGLGYLDNSYTLASVNTFNAAVNKDINAGLTSADAALKNRSLLTVTNLNATTPGEESFHSKPGIKQCCSIIIWSLISMPTAISTLVSLARWKLQCRKMVLLVLIPQSLTWWQRIVQDKLAIVYLLMQKMNTGTMVPLLE
jgi:outer membrane receptor protein involved in Fe transport